MPQGIKQITKAAKNKDEEAVVSLFRQAYDNIFVNEEYAIEECDMTSMSGKRIKFNFHKTGLHPIDERGGLIEGGFIVIGGEAKQGKSTLTLQFARYDYRHTSGSGAYFSFEQGQQELRARVLSAELGIDLGRIMSEDLTLEERIQLRYHEAEFLLKPDPALKAFCTTHADLADEEFFELLYESFEKKHNRFLLIDESLDWDGLLVKMELLRSIKSITFFVIDYPYLVPRGNTDRNLASWEYNLLMSKKLKQFARKHNVIVVAPAQYNAKEDSVSYLAF